VDEYWSRHTVRAPSFLTRRRSERYLKWRFDQYPLFRELTGLWGDHDGEAVLDYGCGPGNDLVGLALYTRAARIVGMDVSRTALGLAADRLALHRVDPGRVELVELSDSQPRVPLEDESVNYVQCLGVLHHTSEPDLILRELHRVLHPGGRACVMVYNRDSVWFHLYTAYERMVLEGAFPGLGVQEAFARNTDGPECPISRSYPAPGFAALCERAGFEARYLGGYLSRRELNSLAESRERAIADERLGREHRDFLRELTLDPSGYPMYRGLYAGIGGVYELRRAADPSGSPS